MYSRKYSLKTRYNFGKVLRDGGTFKTSYLIIKYLKVNEEVLKNDVGKKFGIITSSKFSKKAVIKNKTRRMIGEAIRENIDVFPINHYYIFIPKKDFIDAIGKIKPTYKELSADINTFLSKMAVP